MTRPGQAAYEWALKAIEACLEPAILDDIERELLNGLAEAVEKYEKARFDAGN